MNVPTFFVILFASLALVSGQEKQAHRLVQWSEDEILVMTKSEIEARLNQTRKGWGVGYFDITDSPLVYPQSPSLKDIPTSLSQQSVVNPLLPGLTADGLTSTVSALETYYTRYYDTETGEESAKWIHSEMTKYAEGKSYIEVNLFSHSWRQPSVIGVIKGTSNSGKVIVLGAHEDSVARGGRAPGADDDGTGTAVVMEVFRVLAGSDFRPLHDIHFQTYAAEEVGLRGSGEIAARYGSEKVNVVAMLQMEMSGWVGNSRTIAMIDDAFTNKAVTAFIKVCVDGYSSIQTATTACGYACSDHASFHRQGYFVGCIAEGGPSGANPNMHTPNDLLTHLDMTYTLEFAKTSLGFVVEVANYQ